MTTTKMVDYSARLQLDHGPLPKRLHVGVIGCGYWGPKLIRNFYEHPDSNLVMVADLRAERLAEIDRLYPGVKTTHNHRALFTDDVDAVVVATPVHTHYRLVKEALLAGKHVMVEKPLTTQSRQGEELILLAESQGLTLMVGHTFQYNPAVEAVRKIIQDGDLGRIYYLNLTRANLGLLQPDINVMWDLGPHDLSILSHVLQEDPIKVSAHGGVFVNPWSGHHEVVYMLLTYANGVIANLRLSWLDPVKQRHLTVVGSQKMLVYDDIAHNKVIIYDKGVEVPDYSLTEAEFHASYHHGEETLYPIEWVEPLKVQCHHFLTSIWTGETSRSCGKEALKVVKVLETAQRSLVNAGAELKIEY
jgi:predicted dehydrogenase